MTRKICVVTGSRAEYGLLQWLMREIAADPALRLQVLATGMHLAPEFGLTVRQIRDDGFAVDAEVETKPAGHSGDVRRGGCWRVAVEGALDRKRAEAFCIAA